MSARRWKWLVATVLLLVLLAVIAVAYRDSIGREIVNAALAKSEYSVSDLSVASLTREQLRLSELVIERHDGTRIEIQGISLPVDLRIRRPEQLSAEVVVYSPAVRDARRASYSELLQLGLRANRAYSGVEIRVGRLVTPWLPDLSNVTWRSLDEGHTATFDVSAFVTSIEVIRTADDTYDVSGLIIESSGDDAMSFSAQASVRDGDVLVSADLELELRHWLATLQLLGAVPENVTSLHGTVYGPVGVVVPWDIDAQIIASGSVSSDEAVALTYSPDDGSDIRLRAKPEPHASWLFQFPSLEWTAEAPDATMTVSRGDSDEFDIRFAELECKSGVLCAAVASYRRERIAGQNWELSALRVQAPLSLKVGDELLMSSTQPASVRVGGFDVANHSFRAIELSGQVGYKGNRATADMRISDDGGLGGRLLLSHDTEYGTGSIEMQDAAIRFDRARASRLFRNWPYAWDVFRGELRARATAEWITDVGGLRYSGLARIDLDDLAGAYNELVFRGVNSEVSLEFDGQAGIDVSPVDVVVDLIDIGLPLESVAATLRPDLAQRRLEVAALSLQALGGRISAEPFVYSAGAGATPLVLALDGIQLQLMVDLLKSEGLAVSGSVSGALPVSISAAGLTIDRGKLASNPPGGRIRSQLPIPGGAEDPRLGIVRRSLSNFEFDTMTSDVSYVEGGDLVMKMRISGVNPDVDPDQPVVVNLTVENNLPDLLRSLQAARSINDILSRKLTKQDTSR